MLQRARAWVGFRAGLLGVALASSLAGGCKGGDDEDDSACALPSNARGSTACQRWQTTYCSFLDRCGGGGDQCTCIDQASGVRCSSDSQASSCADALASVGCNSPPSGCDLGDVADPVPAQQGCQSFLGAVCDHDAACVGTPVDQCLADASTQIDCSQAIAIKPKLDQCLVNVGALSCSASELPPTCDAAVVLLR